MTGVPHLLQPGDFFVSRTNTGRWFKRALPALVRWVTNSRWNHAGVYVGQVQLSNGEMADCVVEAQPGGVRYWPVEDYLTEDTLWSEGAFIPGEGVERWQRRSAICQAAEDMLGTKYGLLDCIALALAQDRLHGRIDVRRAIGEQPWWVRRLQRRDTVICSQLVDRAYARAGIHLFQDGRLEDWVTPADLGDLLEGDYEPFGS